jgi:hypothetical protein
MTSNEKALLAVTTVRGASDMTGASKGAIMNAIWTDKIEARKDFGTWLLSVASVAEWNSNRRVNQDE